MRHLILLVTLLCAAALPAASAQAAPRERVALAAGNSSTCAIKTDGSIACWGFDGFGQATAPGGSDGYKAIDAGTMHYCALSSDDALACWGRNDSGQASPLDTLGSVRAVAAGDAHSCAIKADKSVACWGSNDFGVKDVPASVTSAEMISSDSTATCVVKTQGGVACWGPDHYGVQKVPTDLGAVSDIQVGVTHACVLRTDGSPRCWGYDAYGQATPPAGVAFKALSLGYTYSCGIATDDTVRCWGQSTSEGLAVPGDLGKVASIAAGDHHVCAVKQDGRVGCWGESANGELEVPANLVAQPAFSTSSLRFAEQTVGTASAAQLLTVTNDGGPRLEIVAAELSGAAASDFAVDSSACSAGLLPGEQCAIRVVFAPAAAGARDVTLLVRTNGAPNEHIVSLAGTGLAAPVSTPGKPAPLAGGGDADKPRVLAAKLRCAKSKCRLVLDVRGAVRSASIVFKRGRKVLARAKGTAKNGRVAMRVPKRARKGRLAVTLVDEKGARTTIGSVKIVRR